MKKILFITDHFLPGFKAGGPIKSIASLYKMLDKHFEITILTVNHDFQSSQPYDVITDALTSYEGFNIIYLSNTSLFHIDKIIKNLDPDTLYLNSFFSHFSRKILFLHWLRSNKYKVILAPRGELSQEALSLKPFKKAVYLWCFKLIRLEYHLTFHTTDNIEKNAVNTLFPHNTIVNIRNISTSITPSSPIITKQPNRLKILFLSRISRKKNLLFALEILQKISSGKIHFDIFGPIEDNPYWDECMSVISKIPSNIIVEYKGSVHPAQTSAVFQQYHLFFLPTLNENYGHAIVEAMQNGVLPLISTTTPWNQMHTIGWALPLTEKDTFIAAIYEALDMDNIKFKQRSLLIREWINKQIKNDSIIGDYVQMFQNKNSNTYNTYFVEDRL